MISMTPTAVNYIKTAMAKEGVDPSETAVRFGIKGGGCSGFSYVITFTSAKSPIDEEFAFDGLKLYVDKKSMKLIDGTEIDWVTHGLNKQFEFRNPHAAAGCGCGTSFGV